jgi:hypothetical protein
MLNKEAENYEDKYSKHEYELYMGIPLLGAFGSHAITDTYETAYAFHTFGTDKLLWTDMDGYDISEITLYKNVTLSIQGMPVPNDTITVTAVNPYSNYSFTIDVNFTKEPDDDSKKNYLWIGIVAVGVVMIIGLIVAYCRQSKTRKEQQLHHRHELAETLITIEDRISVNMNRSSVDPTTAKDKIEPEPIRMVEPAPGVLEEEEEGSSSEDEEQNLTH